jgi:hypothetical protein
MMQETSRVKRQMSSLEKRNMVMRKVLDGKEEQITQMTGQIHELLPGRMSWMMRSCKLFRFWVLSVPSMGMVSLQS